MKIYVEGGGDAKDLRTKCRLGFNAFFRKAGLRDHMPAVIACGGRREAFESFCTSVAMGNDAILLVDSEDKVPSQNEERPNTWQPWLFLYQRDGWNLSESVAEQANRIGSHPPHVGPLHAHLMVRCMESWFLADVEALKDFYGNGFKANLLPMVNGSIENIEKQKVYDGLKKATKSTKTKGEYSKGGHSFSILERIDPEKVMKLSPWAKRLVEYLRCE